MEMILNACNINGKTAINLALRRGYKELVSFMVNKSIYSTFPREAAPSTPSEACQLKCAVCLDHRTTTVMTLPCRHAKTCQNCMDNLEANDCRTKIIQRIPIYL